MTDRIVKWLAHAGVCSRREAMHLVAQGRVRLNGTVVTANADPVAPGDSVQVDGQPVAQPEATRMWRYHKPAGLVTTHKDPRGRPTVFAAVAQRLPRVVSVGRLDLASEGLLLLTNHGSLAGRLESPDTAWRRRYRVRVHGRVEALALAALAAGITVDGEAFAPIQAELESQRGQNAWLTVAVAEGRNREVRRAMAHLGYTVNRLIRIAYGPFQLGHLPRGELAEIPRKVLMDQLAGLGDAVPADLRRAKGQTDRWARPKPKTRNRPNRKPAGRRKPDRPERP